MVDIGQAITGGLGGLTSVVTGQNPEDENADLPQADPNNLGTDSLDGSEDLSTDEEEEKKDPKREAYLEKISEDRAGFILHQGKILETHTYDTIFSTSWNSDYEGISSDGSISLPFHKDDLQYIYKGVRCLLKTKRLDNFDDTVKIDDEEGWLCFITDVNINENKLDISLSGFEKLLEQENVLSFNNQRRSTILREVIKMAGLVPVIDTDGLADERINWSTEKDSKSEGGSTSTAGASSKFTDCSTTHELSCVHHDTGSMKKGFIPDDIDSKTEYLATIGKTGTNYANYVDGCKTACEVMKKLRDGWGYKCYRDNPYYKCVEQVFDNRSHLNCADSSKLVKCCMDVCGIPCVIIHGHSHYFNAVKVDGKWYNVDLCFRSNLGSEGSTNTLGC